MLKDTCAGVTISEYPESESHSHNADEPMMETSEKAAKIIEKISPNPMKKLFLCWVRGN